MSKNILIIGAARSGKTTLAERIVKELGYSLISIDNLVSGFKDYPELNIFHDKGDVETSKNVAPFLINFFTEISEGRAYADGIRYVIEGTHIDFEKLMPFLQNDVYCDRFEIIGLTYNDISEEQLYNEIKSHDTDDDWTYYCSDEDLRGNVRYFLERNAFFVKNLRNMVLRLLIHLLVEKRRKMRLLPTYVLNKRLNKEFKLFFCLLINMNDV